MINMISGNFAGNGPLFRQNRRNTRASRIQQLIQQRTDEQRKEEQIRKRENKMIKEMQKITDLEIGRLQADEELSADARHSKIRNLTSMIVQRKETIRESREERAEEAAEREAARTKAILEEMGTIQQESAQEHETRAEAEKADEHFLLRGMVNNSMSLDNIREQKIAGADDATVMSSIARLYRDSSQAQEVGLNEYRYDDKEEEEEYAGVEA